jgi:hypothetical protein
MPPEATLFETVCLVVIVLELIFTLVLWQTYHKVSGWYTNVAAHGMAWLVLVRQAQRQLQSTRQSVEAVMPFVYAKLLPLDVMLGAKQGFLAGWATAQARR